MLDTYTAANRVIMNGLAVWKTVERVLGSWTGTTVVASGASVTYGSMWKHVRRASMSYRYVGMDLTTATACAAAMTAKYTRKTRAYVWNPTDGEMGDWTENDGGSVLMAKVSVVRAGDGGAYDVEVDVDETDEKWQKKRAAVSWALEDARDYGTDGEGTADEKEAAS